MTATRRHAWSVPMRYPHKTERSCLNMGCGVVKVTRHETGEDGRAHHWITWYRERPGELPELIQKGGPTPPCGGAADQTSQQPEKETT